MNFAVQFGSRPFLYDKMESFYVNRCGLTREQTDQLLQNTSLIRQLRIEGLNWLPMDQAFNQFRDLSIASHYEAMSQAYDFPFRDIEDVYRQHIDAEILPPRILNRTVFHRIPPNAHSLPIGTILIQLGLISEATFQRGMGIQRIIEMETGQKAFLALILNHIGKLSVHDFYHALALQVGIEYWDLEQADTIIHALRERPVKPRQV